MGPLRKITVHVVEPEPRRFTWVLSEILPKPERISELERAPEAAPTYRQAMASGLSRLQAMIHDLDAGPRAHEAEVPVLPTAAKAAAKTRSSSARRAASPAPSSVPRKRPFFGFGPVR